MTEFDEDSNVIINKKHKKRKHDEAVEKIKKKKKTKHVEMTEIKTETNETTGIVEKKKKKKKDKNKQTQFIETKEELDKVVETESVNITNDIEIKPKFKSKKVQELPTVTIAVPGSILDNAQSPELRTYLAGQIARAACIYKIDEVYSVTF